MDSTAFKNSRRNVTVFTGSCCVQGEQETAATAQERPECLRERIAAEAVSKDSMR